MVDHAGHAQVACRNRGYVTTAAAIALPWPTVQLAQDVCCAARQMNVSPIATRHQNAPSELKSVCCAASQMTLQATLPEGACSPCMNTLLSMQRSGGVAY